MDWTRIRCIAPATTPIVTAADARIQCRIAHSDDDAYLTSLIAVATAFIEGPAGIGTALLPSKWRLRMDALPKFFTIALGPVRSIDLITVAGQTIPSTLYTADLDSNPARITGSYIPRVAPTIVEFTAGYDAVPADLRHAVLMIVAHLYENREASIAGGTTMELTTVPFAVEAILARYR